MFLYDLKFNDFFASVNVNVGSFIIHFIGNKSKSPRDIWKKKKRKSFVTSSLTFLTLVNVFCMRHLTLCHDENKLFSMLIHLSSSPSHCLIESFNFRAYMFEKRFDLTIYVLKATLSNLPYNRTSVNLSFRFFYIYKRHDQLTVEMWDPIEYTQLTSTSSGDGLHSFSEFEWTKTVSGLDL